jgi:hypothetical protein
MVRQLFEKRSDTVGELGSLENCVSRLPSLKAQDHGNAYAERLALEGRNLFANSIRSCVDSHKTWRGDHERHAGAGEASDAVDADGVAGLWQCARAS